MNEAQRALAHLSRVTNRRYPELEKLLGEHGNAALAHDLLALVRDVEMVARLAEKRGARQPWKHGGF